MHVESTKTRWFMSGLLDERECVEFDVHGDGRRGSAEASERWRERCRGER